MQSSDLQANNFDQQATIQWAFCTLLKHLTARARTLWQCYVLNEQSIHHHAGHPLALQRYREHGTLVSTEIQLLLHLQWFQLNGLSTNSTD
jgi:hypothetical protein